MGSPRSGERGAGLIEILVAMTILGITSAALLGAVFTLARTSSGHSNQAKAETVLTSAADALRDPSVANVTCATEDEPTYLTAVRSVTLPDGWTSSAVDITQLLYWDGEEFVDDDTDCAEPLLPLQLVTIEVTSPDGSVSEAVAVVKS